MIAHDESGTRLHRGQVAKRHAITRAARAVFGRDGYARTGIDVIAAEAGVSTRTIYNHFTSKEQLFSFVIQESAAQVAGVLGELIERHLGEVDDIERALVALGHAWTTPQASFAAHFALVRQLHAEAAHVPQAILRAWSDAGPLRAERELARHLRRLAGQGILHIADAPRAASHFLLLTVGELNSRSYFGGIPLGTAEVAKIVTAGVRAFLNGYLPRRAGGPERQASHARRGRHGARAASRPRPA